jgi:ribosomal protein S18 acetylase RimI-like enzyme
MSVVVRSAVAEDVSAVAGLEQAVFGVDAWSPESVREELTGERRHAVVALADGGIVGYAVTLRTDDLLDLQRIAVATDRRRSGLAGLLLDTVRGAGRTSGAHWMLLEVSAANAGALAFYAAEGFVQIDRRPRYYRDGSDALVLRATLGGAACGGKAV